MLVQLREVKKFLRETIGLATLTSLVKELFESLILGSDICQLLIQICYAVVILSSVRVPHELTVIASENNCRTVNLMLEDVLVGRDLFASAVTITTLKFNLG